MAKTIKRNRALVIQKKTRSNNLSNLFSQIKLGESYTSLILGAVVVIVGLVLVFSLLKGKNNQIQQTDSSNTVQTEQTGTVEKTYVVKSGDDLWHISETLYGSGYNWVDLAKANNLANPSVIYTGTKLIVPNVKPVVVAQNSQVTPEVKIQATQQQENKITGASYKISHGDDLWDIAVRAYGDGYKWIDIAKANNLDNPNLIHSDNILKLPR